MASIIAEKAGGRPLVFNNSYNEPSYYTFYTGRECFAVNDIWYKKTQYNYLPQLEQKFQDKAVAYVSDGPVDKTSREISIPQGKKYYLTFIDHFSSFTGVKVRVLNPAGTLQRAAPIRMQVVIDAPQQYIGCLKSTGAFIIIAFTNNLTQQVVYNKYPLLPGFDNGKPFQVVFSAPIKPGNYRYQFSIVAKQHVGVEYNSNVYNCKVN